MKINFALHLKIRMIHLNSTLFLKSFLMVQNIVQKIGEFYKKIASGKPKAVFYDAVLFPK